MMQEATFFMYVCIFLAATAANTYPFTPFSLGVLTNLVFCMRKCVASEWIEE